MSLLLLYCHGNWYRYVPLPWLKVVVSIKRLREFLTAEELDPDNVDWEEEPATGGCSYLVFDTLAHFYQC